MPGTPSVSLVPKTPLPTPERFFPPLISREIFLIDSPWFARTVVPMPADVSARTTHTKKEKCSEHETTATREGGARVVPSQGSSRASGGSLVGLRKEGHETQRRAELR